MQRGVRGRTAGLCAVACVFLAGCLVWRVVPLLTLSPRILSLLDTGQLRTSRPYAGRTACGGQHCPLADSSQADLAAFHSSDIHHRHHHHHHDANPETRSERMFRQGSEAEEGDLSAQDVSSSGESSLKHESASAAPPEQRDRYLIFECVEGRGLCGGWADRQEGLVTAFLLANLTRRRFGIRVTTPCNLTRFFLPAQYDWVVRDSEIRGRSTRHISAIDNSHFSRKMASVDFNARYPQDVVFLHTNRDLLKDISANPHYRHVLPPWARRPRPQFFSHVWRTLMKPSPALQRRRDAYLRSLGYFNRPRSPVVGVHVRTGGSSHFADTNFVRCIYGDRLSHLNVLWDFVQPYVDNGSDVFVATDNPDVRRSSESKFGGRHHDTQATLRHIDRQRADPDVCQAFGGAILDQLILASCDVLVISPGSGFSSRAAMLRGKTESLFHLGLDRISPADLYKLCDPHC